MPHTITSNTSFICLLFSCIITHKLYTAFGPTNTTIKHTYQSREEQQLEDPSNTPLHLAVLTEEIISITSILKLTDNPNPTNNDQQTPLHFAAKQPNNSLPLVAFLLSNNADPTAQDRVLKTPVQYAIKNNNYRNFISLISPKTINTPNCIGQTPLMTAIQHQRHEKVKILMHAKADVTQKRDFRDYNALHVAADVGNTKAIQILLSEHLSEINTPAQNKTALDIAQIKANKEAALLLQNQGGKTYQKIKW